MKHVSDGVTKNRVRTNVHAVRLLGEYFHQIQHTCLLTALFILMFPGMAAACWPLHWLEFSQGILGYPFFIEALFFWLLATKFFKCRINFWWILIVTFFANVVATGAGVLFYMNVLPRIDIQEVMGIILAFAMPVFIEWAIYVIIFHRKMLNSNHLLTISFAANVVSYTLIAVAYVIYLANPPPYTLNKLALIDIQNVVAAQASYFSDHATYAATIEELIAEEDFEPHEGVIVHLVFADKEDFAVVAYHKKGNTGYKRTRSTGYFDKIPIEDAIELIEEAVKRKQALAAGLEEDEPIDVNWDIQIQKAIQRGNINENSPEVDLLIEALRDDRAWVRKDAVRFLGVINVSRSLKPLIDVVKNDADYHVRLEALKALGKMKNVGAIDLWIETLTNKELDAETRYAAAWALSNTKDPRAADPLFESPEYPAQRLRKIATHTLEKMGDPKAFERLIAILRGENRHLNLDAVLALAGFEDPRAVEPLIAAMRDTRYWVRESAAEALSEIPDPRAIGPLIGALSDWHSTVRHSAATTLGSIIDLYGLEPLVAATKDERWWVREAAILALGMTENPDTIEVLVDGLHDERPEVRRNAASALGTFEDSRAVESLIHALGDKDSSKRGESACSLGVLGDPRAVEALLAIIDDESPDVRQSVLYALNEIMGVPHYHQRDSTQWLEWCKQNQAGYGSENSNPFEETESKKREKRTDPRKRRQKKETVSIVGTWTLFAPSKYCVDSVTFNPDHTFTIISGQEIQKGVYAYQKPVKTGKRHKLKTHFKYDNGLPDCSGREYKFTNQKLTHYLEFEYGGKAFTLFTTPSGSEFLVGLWKKV